MLNLTRMGRLDVVLGGTEMLSEKVFYRICVGVVIFHLASLGCMFLAFIWFMYEVMTAPSINYVMAGIYLACALMLLLYGWLVFSYSRKKLMEFPDAASYASRFQGGWGLFKYWTRVERAAYVRDAVGILVLIGLLLWQFALQAQALLAEGEMNEFWLVFALGGIVGLFGSWKLVRLYRGRSS